MQTGMAGVLAAALAMVTQCGIGDPVPTPTPTPTATPTPTPTPAPTPVGLNFLFATDSPGWIAGHADYAEAQASLIDFVAEGPRRVPDPLGSRSGYFLGGTNRSDDLTMFISRQIEGLGDRRAYRVEAEVVIASNVPPGCVGVGGSPGESVYIKAGAAPRRPAVTRDAAGDYHVNVDKGQQAESGTEAVAIGDFAAPGAGTCNAGRYAVKTLPVAGQPPVVRSNDNGKLWLFLATDSAFESRTEIYFLEARFSLIPV